MTTSRFLTSEDLKTWGPSVLLNKMCVPKEGRKNRMCIQHVYHDSEVCIGKTISSLKTKTLPLVEIESKWNVIVEYKFPFFVEDCLLNEQQQESFFRLYKKYSPEDERWASDALRLTTYFSKERKYQTSPFFMDLFNSFKEDEKSIVPIFELMQIWGIGFSQFEEKFENCKDFSVSRFNTLLERMNKTNKLKLRLTTTETMAVFYETGLLERAIAFDFYQVYPGFKGIEAVKFGEFDVVPASARKQYVDFAEDYFTCTASSCHFDRVRNGKEARFFLKKDGVVVSTIMISSSKFYGIVGTKKTATRPSDRRDMTMEELYSFLKFLTPFLGEQNVKHTKTRCSWMHYKERSPRDFINSVEPQNQVITTSA